MPLTLTRRQALLLGASGTAALGACRHAAAPITRAPLPLGLPDPLVFANGTPVIDAAAWKKLRRPEILKLFRDQVYGHAPDSPTTVRTTVLEEGPAFSDQAMRKQIRITFGADDDAPRMDLLMFLPSVVREKPVPVFLVLNFNGNHTVCADPAVSLASGWVKNNPATFVTDNIATEQGRGADSNRYPIEMILARGYGLVTAYYGDLDPDHDDGFANGVHPLAPQRSPGAWGAIGAWAWGLQRAMDHLQTDTHIDGNRVAVIGHSRLGKTALWAGAQDERFAMVISNDSGCGGAAISRQRGDGIKRETVARIQELFPHWFCGNFKQYGNNEAALPLDQHMLIALAAPRPVYVASAADDLWADPLGEFNGLLHADPVYRLLGTDGLPVNKQPAVDQPVKTGTMAYHIRSGKHDLTRYDWQQYLDFADLHLDG